MTSLTSGEHDESTPAWSPDGRYIAYVSKRGKDPDRNYNYDIYLIEPHKAHSERQLTHYLGSDMSPDFNSNIAWSPDSLKIAYLRSQEGKYSYYAPSKLAIITLNKGEERLVTTADKWFYKPQWALDGKSIYALIEENRNTFLYQINPETGQLTQLTNGLRHDEDYAQANYQIVLFSDIPRRTSYAKHP